MIEEVPSIEELIQSVVGLIKHEVAPAVAQSELKFKLQVACNVLGIVEREIAGGKACSADEKQVLGSLIQGEHESLEATRKQLSERIRVGEFDQIIEAVADLLLPVVMDRIAIDNPRYSTLLALQPEREKNN